MKYKRNRTGGFTLVELLTALLVCSIILTAVASLAFAINSANKGADESIEFQLRLRFLQLRLGELFSKSKMICSSSSSDVSIWVEDSDGDLQIDTGELVYIDTGTNGDEIRLIEFNNIVDSNIRLSQLRDGTVKGWLINNTLNHDSLLLDGVSNVEFIFDVAAPRTNFAAIKFDYSESEGIKTYEVSSRLLSDSDYLLDDSDNLLTLDDD